MAVRSTRRRPSVVVFCDLLISVIEATRGNEDDTGAVLHIDFEDNALELSES